MKLLVAILIACLIVPPAFGDCNFATDIKKNPDGSYTYSADCHLEVGKRIQENELRKQQVDELTKSLTMKDLALTQANGRIELWQNTTFKLEDRVNTIEHMNDTQKLIWTIVGAGAMAIAVWGAGHLK